MRYQDSMTNRPIVAVHGQANLEVPPDFARLIVDAHVSDRLRARVEAHLTEISQAIDAIIRQADAALAHHTVSAFSITPVRSSRKAVAPDRFDGHRNWTIDVRDFGVLPELVAGLSFADEISLNGPHWMLAADSPAHRQARLAAVADAVARAQDYAAAFGAALDALIEIADAGLDAGASPMFARAAGGWAEDAGLAAIDLEPQPQQVHGAVRARFAMTPPGRLLAEPVPEGD